MKQLTEQQIQDNWLKLRGIINDTFEGERLEKLNKMYDYFEDRMVVAPASAKEHYHNACVGGYVEHVIHIVEMSQQVRDLWLQNGADINFTNEELIFAALHHDLGKVGDLEHDYYIPQDEDVRDFLKEKVIENYTNKLPHEFKEIYHSCYQNTLNNLDNEHVLLSHAGAMAARFIVFDLFDK